jgi:hypothetical protein
VGIGRLTVEETATPTDESLAWDDGSGLADQYLAAAAALDGDGVAEEGR